MNPEYFETHFDPAGFDGPWPLQFAIITAYATTGEQWLPEVNNKADLELKFELLKLNVWTQRITGFSPKTRHSEPGWAVDLSFSDACDLGQRFRQDAIYYVRDDQLLVSHCDSRRHAIFVGHFRDRLHVGWDRRK